MDCRIFAEVQQNAEVITNLMKASKQGWERGKGVLCWSWGYFPVSQLKGSRDNLAPLLLAGFLALGDGDRCVVNWKEHGGYKDHFVWVRSLAESRLSCVCELGQVSVSSLINNSKMETMATLLAGVLFTRENCPATFMVRPLS